MSQQTQISRVEHALPRFLARFPTLRALAEASPADVIRAWAGLGYNRRAVGLWRAAGTVVREHVGEMPRDVAALEALPGIGPYTARAVAAFAFGVPVTAVDTNARRVLGRALTGSAADTAHGSTGAAFRAAADALTPPERAAAWNHALMDLGSLVCRPRPLCDACPLAAACRYRSEADGAGDERRAGGMVPAPHTEVHRRRARRSGAAEHASQRRLRGRIVTRLRDADVGAWVAVDPGAVDGSAPSVIAALDALERDGLIEQRAGGEARLRT